MIEKQFQLSITLEFNIERKWGRLLSLPLHCSTNY